MFQPIRGALKGKFDSIDALARDLSTQASELEWPAARSLSAKVGQLDKGETTWWQRRPAHAKALADLLGLDVADLGLHAKAGGDSYYFQDFPELPPLDLRRETFPQLAEPRYLTKTSVPELDEWLNTSPSSWVRRGPHDTTWLHVPSGMGRSVLLAKIAAAKRFDVIEVASISDAILRLKKPDPIVISVSVDGGIEDLVALSQRPDDAGTLIIAQFPAPSRPGADPLEAYSWEAVTADRVGRRILGLTNPRGLWDSIHSASWQLKQGWQDHLLEWVEARLQLYGVDTLFSAKGLRRWLHFFDPQQEWVRSPSDLIPLCRASHRAPETKLPRHSDPRAGQKLLKVFMDARPYQDTLFSELAVERWNSLDDPWRASLPLKTWEVLSPKGMSELATEILLSIADAPNKDARRAEAKRVAERIATGGVRSLIADGLLTEDGQGRWDLRPRSLADMLVRDHLMTQMRNGPLRSWALACFDAERRPTVDAALDALSMGDLASVAQQLDREPTWASAELAASESLFCAVGRRVLLEEKIPDPLHALAIRVIPRLDLAYEWSLVAPWTRDISTEREWHEWLAICWAWSSMSKPDLPELAEYSGWSFLGWSIDLLETPYWFPALSDETHRDVFPASWGRLLDAADLVIHNRDIPLPSAPPFLHGALLAASANGSWPAEPQWWVGVLGFKPAEKRLLKQLERDGTQAAIRLWPSLVRYAASKTDRLDAVYIGRSSVRVWILEHLHAEEVLSGLGDKELTYMMGNVFSFPPRVRAVLLAHMPEAILESNHEYAAVFFRWCVSDSTENLAKWFGTSVGYLAAEQLWKVLPHGAVEWIRASAEAQKEIAEMVILQCPQEHTVLAVELLTAISSLLSQDERREWVKSRLPMAGAASDKYMEVMNAL